MNLTLNKRRKAAKRDTYHMKTAFQILYSSIGEEDKEEAQAEHMQISHSRAPIPIHGIGAS